MLDLLGIVECSVHIPVTMGIRNALNGFCSGFTKCKGRADSLDKEQFVFFTILFAFGGFFFFFLSFFRLLFIPCL